MEAKLLHEKYLVMGTVGRGYPERATISATTRLDNKLRIRSKEDPTT